MLRQAARWNIKDSLYGFSIEYPLDWSKTADETGLIGFGFGAEGDSAWGRVTIYTDKDPEYELTGLTDGFIQYQGTLKQRYKDKDFELIENKMINNPTIIAVMFYRFSTPTLQGKGIYLLNADARIVVEFVSPHTCYQQYALESGSILQSFQLSNFAPQQFIDFPMPDEGMQQLALANPSDLSHQVDEHIQKGKMLLDNKDVSPNNLFDATQEYRNALQLAVAPPQRLPTYRSAAEGLVTATKLFNQALDQQRFEITSALKQGDRDRAYWEANKMMQIRCRTRHTRHIRKLTKLSGRCHRPRNNGCGCHSIIPFMSAVLLVTKDKKLTAKVAVTGNSFVMGRSPDCNIPLDEALASRQHAEIILERAHIGFVIAAAEMAVE